MTLLKSNTQEPLSAVVFSNIHGWRKHPHQMWQLDSQEFLYCAPLCPNPMMPRNGMLIAAGGKGLGCRGTVTKHVGRLHYL